MFGVMANVCFLLGPAIEIALQKLWGEKLLPAHLGAVEWDQRSSGWG